MNIIIIGLLLWIAIQDFSKREISLVLLIFSFALLVVKQIILKGNIQYAIVIINLVFVLVQLLLVTVYFGFKHENINALKQYIGWGDILFLPLPVLVFSPVNFLAWYILSLIITLLGYIAYAALKGGAKHIPLAGSMALCLIPFIASPKSYDDSFLINLILKINA